MNLRNPLLASASPLSRTVDGVRRLADAGVGAVVLYSLFEEQLRSEAEHDERMAAQGSESYAESSELLPCRRRCRPWRSSLSAASGTRGGRGRHPLLGSLNASAPGSWARYARWMQDAGAAAVELNIYYLPGDTTGDTGDTGSRHYGGAAPPRRAGRSQERRNGSGRGQAQPILQRDRRRGTPARRRGRGRAGAVQPVLQPDIDPETLSTVRSVALSTPSETRLPLTWIALLHGRIRASLAASTGVEQAADVAKYLLAGADVVQSASALLRHGPEYASVLLQGLSDWMSRKGFQSLDDVRGLLAAPDAANSEARERADYVWAVRKANNGIYDAY